MLTNYNQGVHNTFTLADSFSGLPAFLTATGLKGVLGLSTAFASTSAAFTAATTGKCLIGSNVPATPLAGSLDQVNVGYLDSFTAASQDLLDTNIATLLTKAPISGMIIQDSFVSNDLTNQPVKPAPTDPHARFLKSEESIGSYQPYVLNAAQDKASFSTLPFQPTKMTLDYLTAPMSSTQGEATAVTNNFYVHNINGQKTLQRVAGSWAKANKDNNQRPFLLTDSHWANAGVGVAVLTGHNRDWMSMKNVVSQALTLSMSG